MFKKSTNTDEIYIFAWFFLLTGIFAIVGSLSSWGTGWLFSQNSLNKILLPTADLIITGPISIISAFGLWKKRNWSIPLALVTIGIYTFGSVLVFISLIWNGYPYPIQLIIPPIFGTVFSAIFYVKAVNTK